MIASRLQQRRQGIDSWADLILRKATRQTQLPVLHGIEPGQNRTARGAAGGLGNIGLLKDHTCSRQLIDMGRLRLLVSVGTQLGPQIIGDDEQHIEPARDGRAWHCDGRAWHFTRAIAGIGTSATAGQ